ncbi:MAG: efflux RND transporter periplasmic adaptor subunit, partial [Bacteroidota bacterium]
APIAAAQYFGLGEGNFFNQHCPMANDFSGADWISEDTEVLNPYFGDEMLHCGHVEDTISGR